MANNTTAQEASVEPYPFAMPSPSSCTVPSAGNGSSHRDSAIVLNCIGTKLYTAGHHTDAMSMFDSALQVLKAPISPNFIEPSSDPAVVMAAQRAAWGQQKLSAVASSSQSTENAFQEHPLDTYYDGECDVGPRPFRTALHMGLESGAAAGDSILEAVFLFNVALVQHSQSNLEGAAHIYGMALKLLSFSLAAPRSPKTVASSLNQASHLGMLIHNNLGQINYVLGENDEARASFLSALAWARQMTSLTEHKEYRLTVATIMSNCCRSRWMTMDASDDALRAFNHVLVLRSSVLPWDHPDVASAHYNMGIMEFARGNGQEALRHFEQYLKVGEALRKTSQDGNEQTPSYSSSRLDTIPALTYVLIIKNEGKEDASSLELVRCLHLLIDKREDLGSIASEVATLLNYVGALLFQRRELDHAIEYYIEELRVEQSLLASRSGGSSSDDSNMGGYEYDDKDETAPLSLAVTFNNIGRILQERGRYHEAMRFYQKALKTESSTNKSGAELAASIAAGRLPTSLAGEDETDEEKAASSSTANLFATIWYNLGLIHDMMDSHKDAIQCFQMSLGLRRVLLGPNHPDVACLWYNIGTLQMESQMLSEATASLRESLRIRRMGGPCSQNDVNIVITLQKLASLLQNSGNVSGALEACTEVLHHQRTNGVSDGSADIQKQIGNTLRAMAELHHARGDLDRALETAQECLNALKSSHAYLDASHINHLVCVEHIATCLLLIGSLHHERCNSPIEHATAAFAEAGRIVAAACASDNDDKSKTERCSSPTLMPLLELSHMLACSHCAPEA